MADISNRARERAAVTTLGGRQEGLVSRRQLEAIEISPGRIVRWVKDGRLHPVFPGVFALGHRATGPRARMRAAALACAGAAISHRSAAFLLGIGEVAPIVVDLIPTEQRGRQIAGIKAHRVPCPARSELVRVAGIVCTNVARTFVDLAGTHGEDGLRRTFERAATRRVLDLAAIDAVLANGPRRRGAPCLRRVMKEWRPVAEIIRYATVRSLFEAKLLPLLAAANLPMPRFNAPVRTATETFEVDLLWPTERFVVEADSRLHHGIEVAFERDRHRDRELMAVHHAVLRVTWREAEDEPDKVFAVVRAELEARARRPP